MNPIISDIRSDIDYIQDELVNFSDSHLLKFVENALFLESQTHHWHLQARTHTKHVELDELYKGLPEFVDYFVEILMESRGPIIASGDSNYVFQSVEMCLDTLEKFKLQCETVHKVLDAEEQVSAVNALEDLMSFLDSCMMKLKFLD